ncbi:MAG: GH92 family glycosyl hydrolase [Verrucomicrobiota bacterium]
MRPSVFLLILLTALFPCLAGPSAKDPADYVNPFIGAGSMEGLYKNSFHGKNFPGAATPNGMVQLSPDTITGGDNGGGYSYVHTTVQGFSFNHMSGVGWYGDLGNFEVMPTTGPLKTWYGETDKPGSGYLSSIDKATEVARAGYYAVTLKDYGIRTEATAAPHSGMLRFTYPENTNSRIQVDLARRIGGTSLSQTVKVVGTNAIEGAIVCTPEGGGWGHGRGHANFTVYYHAEFSRPLKNVGCWSAKLPRGPYRDILQHPDFIQACQHAEILPGLREKDGQHLGFYTEFPTKAGEQVVLKAGISYVSIEGACANLAKEIPGWDFDAVRKQAHDAWNRELGRITVEGGTDAQKITFYTAMYHAMIDPRIFADLNGDYTGGDGKIHPTSKFTKRTIFSGWDVYRSEYPLLTLIAPEVINDVINSWIELADQNGKHYFDRWEMLNAYSGCMAGAPAVIVINDAYQKGIRNYDLNKAYDYSTNSIVHQAGSSGGGSTRVEDDFAKWNLGQLAASLGKKEDAARYQQDSLAYREFFDPDVPWCYEKQGKISHPEWKGWFWLKDKEGKWLPWEGLTSPHGAEEGTIFQYGWHAPHDIPGLIKLLGGRELFVAKLSDFFDRTPELAVCSDFENQSNEPSHLIPFFFNRAGAPWLTQKWVRRICTEAYGSDYKGLCGDEDEGQMSAWYVLAASGLSQASPGDTRFEIFTPLFDKVTLRLDPKYSKGGTFTITAKNNSPENVYIQSAMLNGKPLNRCWLDYKEIASGGQLDLVLGPNPNKNWGIDTQ